MTFNLLDEQWLPVIRADGTTEVIAPTAITHGDPANPIVALAPPRPDFAGALMEFLIGLLATTFAPSDHDEWRERWNVPPSAEDLSTAMQHYADAFDLDGEGPRFLQDLASLEADPTPVANLLIEAPGDQTLRKNADLFVKRGQVVVLSRAAAAMALLTLQTYAPAGGAGNMTSLRGGGPLTTLIVADQPAAAGRPAGPTLWARLWPNVPTRAWIADRVADLSAPMGRADIFPWLAATRVSGPGGVRTTPADTHPLQMFWGMPRRIRLDFRPAAPGEVCSLTGVVDPVVVETCRTRPRGVDYKAGWRHPLSPHYEAKAGEWLPVHAGPGGLRYRHWLGLVQPAKGRAPAEAVTSFIHHRAQALPGRRYRLSAFGYDMDNMKARCWYAGEMPLLHVEYWGEIDDDRSTEDRLRLFETFTGHLIEGADRAARATTQTVRSALYDRPAEASGDFGWIGDRFWQDTEAAFYRAVGRLPDAVRVAPDADDPGQPLRLDWLGTLRRAALTIFDDAVETDGIEMGEMRRMVTARQNLVRTFAGRGKPGEELFTALYLRLPEKTAREAA